MTSVASQQHTKHLGVVESTASDAYSAVGSTYSAAKDKALSMTPDFFDKLVSSIEHYAKPLLSYGLKGSINALILADKTVDTGVNVMNSTATYSHKQAVNLVGEDRMKPVDNAITNARTTMNDGIDCVRKEGVFGAAKAGASRARSFVGGVGSYMRTTAQDAAHTLNDSTIAIRRKVGNAYENVARQYISPAVNKGGDAAMRTRDAITRMPLYAACYNFVYNSVTYAKDMQLVRASVDLFNKQVYPVVRPAADPVVQRASPLVSKLHEFVKPPTTTQAKTHVNGAANKPAEAAKKKVDRGESLARDAAGKVHAKGQDASEAVQNQVQSVKRMAKKNMPDEA